MNTEALEILNCEFSAYTISGILQGKSLKYHKCLSCRCNLTLLTGREGGRDNHIGILTVLRSWICTGLFKVVLEYSQHIPVDFAHKWLIILAVPLWGSKCVSSNYYDGGRIYPLASLFPFPPFKYEYNLSCQNVLILHMTTSDYFPWLEKTQEDFGNKKPFLKKLYLNCTWF